MSKSSRRRGAAAATNLETGCSETKARRTGTYQHAKEFPPPECPLIISSTPVSFNIANVLKSFVLTRNYRYRKFPMNTFKVTWPAAAVALAVLSNAYAEQPPPPCHPNPNAAADRLAVANRGDVVKLPGPLQGRLVQLADRPHTYLPLQAFAEADKPSQLFQYYLLDTGGFEPNVFTDDTSGHQRYRPVDRDRRRLRAAHPRQRAGGARTEARVAHRSQGTPRHSSTSLPIFRRSSSSTTRADGTRAG